MFYVFLREVRAASAFASLFYAKSLKVRFIAASITAAIITPNVEFGVTVS